MLQNRRLSDYFTMTYACKMWKFTMNCVIEYASFVALSNVSRLIIPLNLFYHDFKTGLKAVSSLFFADINSFNPVYVWQISHVLFLHYISKNIQIYIFLFLIISDIFLLFSYFFCTYVLRSWYPLLPPFEQRLYCLKSHLHVLGSLVTFIAIY